MTNSVILFQNFKNSKPFSKLRLQRVLIWAFSNPKTPKFDLYQGILELYCSKPPQNRFVLYTFSNFLTHFEHIYFFELIVEKNGFCYFSVFFCAIRPFFHKKEFSPCSRKYQSHPAEARYQVVL